MVKDMESILKIKSGEDFKIITVDGHKFIQFPGFAPKELKTKEDEYEAKAMLHDYYLASKNYYDSLYNKADKNTQQQYLNEMMSVFRSLKKFRGAPASPEGKPAAPAAPNAGAAAPQTPIKMGRFTVTPEP